VPLSFNQIYFLGFHNYLISIPACLFALRYFSDVYKQPGNFRAWVLLLLCLAVTVLAHQYTLLVFITLASLMVLLEHRENSSKWPLLILGGASVCIVSWVFLGSLFEPELADQKQLNVLWLPLSHVLQFSAMMFTGMTINDGVSWEYVLCWLAIIAAMIWAGSGKPIHVTAKSELGLLIATASGVLLLPFAIGDPASLDDPAYLNLRLLPFVFILCALFLSKLRLNRIQVITVFISCALLVTFEIERHRSISKETGTIMPIVEAMRPNATILPVYEATSSAFLDPVYFYQFHLHDHNYYHVYRGGGTNPLIWKGPLFPVAPRQGAEHQDPNDSSVDSLEHFDYIISRGAARESLEQDLGIRSSVTSGAWSLFELKN
jgi:hypothetical protein